MLLIGALTACGPRAGGSATGSRLAEVNTGLNALASNTSAAVSTPPDPTLPMSDREKEAWANQAALNLEQLLKEGALEPRRNRDNAQAAAPANAPSQQAPKPSPPQSQSNPEQGVGLAAAIGEAGETAESRVDPTPEHVPAPSEPRTVAQNPSDPLADLASRMAGLLRQTLPNGKPALSDTAALEPLESMRPGVLATLEQDDHPLAGLLATSDLTALRDARRRVLASPDQVSPALLSAIRGSQSSPVLAITRSALCTRVAGFGRFEPYPSQSFVAGRPIRAIVYTELDGFKTRAARPGDPVQQRAALSEQVSVELSQSLSLYHDRDGLLAWHRPPQSVTETSLSARRDFYLIQIIELPPTLSVGRYNLKVRVSDATTGAETESIIPLEVVADPRLLMRPR